MDVCCEGEVCVFCMLARVSSVLKSLKITRGGLKGAARRPCRQWRLRDAPEYKLIYCIQGHHQLGTMHAHGHWQLVRACETSWDAHHS